MRRIIKLPIDATIQNQLLAKQQSIDNGTTPPHWNLNRVQKIEIKNKLLQAQKYLCCYCECEIDYNNHHIEHFHERHDRPDKIYDFDNLILSCEGQKEPLRRPETSTERSDRLDNIRCGHGKTKTQHQGVEIDYALLLNPMQDNGLFSSKVWNSRKANVFIKLWCWIVQFCTFNRRIRLATLATLPDNAALLYYNDSGEVEHNTSNQAEIDKVIYTCERLNLNSSRLKNQRIDIIKLLNNELDQLNLTDRKAYIQALLNEQQPQLPAFYSTIKDNFGFIVQE